MGNINRELYFARESQTVKALIKIILLIRRNSSIYVLVQEEHLLCKGCAIQVAEVGLDSEGFSGSPVELKGRVTQKQGSLVDLGGCTFQCEEKEPRGFATVM